MKFFAKNVLVGLSVAASILLVYSTPAKAQVRGGSADVAGDAGYYWVGDNNHAISTSNNHGVYGFNGGYNVTPHVAVIGEYLFSPLFSMDGLTVHGQLYGGGVRFNVNPKSRVVGYGVFTVGGDRDTEKEGSESASYSGYYFAFGGGASCYIGHNWGVRPEFKYVRPEISNGPENLTFNAITMTGGVFFQFGGHK